MGEHCAVCLHVMTNTVTHAQSRMELAVLLSSQHQLSSSLSQVTSLSLCWTLVCLLPFLFFASQAPEAVLRSPMVGLIHWLRTPVMHPLYMSGGGAKNRRNGWTENQCYFLTLPSLSPLVQPMMDYDYCCIVCQHEQRIYISVLLNPPQLYNNLVCLKQ